MHYGSIKLNDVANGPGVRVNLFVSGCTHRCKNCFNEDTWDFNYGDFFTEEEFEKIIKALEPSYIAGITFLGGEPMEASNRGEVLQIAKKCKELYPDKNIWCYSGYLTEELLAMSGIWSPDRVPSTTEVPRNRVPDCTVKPNDHEELAELMNLIDVLVDGEFVNEKRNLMLKFRGSENQRLVDLKETIKAGQIIELD